MTSKLRELAALSPEDFLRSRMLFTVVKPQQIFHQFQIYTNTNAPRGFTIEKTPSDGNCLFPSLLLVLSESCNLAAFLRLGACWYGARHQDHFLDQLKKDDVDNYGHQPI